MKIETSFLGKRFCVFLKGEDAVVLEAQVARLKAEAKRDALRQFEFALDDIKERLIDGTFVPPEPKRRRRVEPITQVSAPAPVYKPEGRVRTQPVPQVVEPKIKTMYNLSEYPESVAQVRVFKHVNSKTVVDPIDESKRYTLDEYGQTSGWPTFDPDYIYWWDYNAGEYIFKTHIDEAQQWN